MSGAYPPPTVGVGSSTGSPPSNTHHASGAQRIGRHTRTRTLGADTLAQAQIQANGVTSETSSSSSAAAAATAFIDPTTAPRLTLPHGLSSPSLTGELLRQTLSAYLRTQVCSVTLVIVMYGFNSHSYKMKDDIPIREGKLCYAVLTPSELILVDRTQIQTVSSG